MGVSQMSTRCELGAVLYQYNVMGVRGPRKMTALAPKVDSNGRRKMFRAGTELAPSIGPFVVMKWGFSKLAPQRA